MFKRYIEWLDSLTESVRSGVIIASFLLPTSVVYYLLNGLINKYWYIW